MNSKIHVNTLPHKLRYEDQGLHTQNITATPYPQKYCIKQIMYPNKLSVSLYIWLHANKNKKGTLSEKCRKITEKPVVVGLACHLKMGTTQLLRFFHNQYFP